MSLAPPPTPESPAQDAQLATRNRVLLLGNDDRVLLAVARGLGRHGIDVHAGWCDADSPALASRYISTRHEIATYSASNDKWLDQLNALVENNRFDLVIPCNDFSVLPLQIHSDSLSATTRWYLLDDSCYRVTADKHQTAELARRLSVSVPKEVIFRRHPDNPEAWESLENQTNDSFEQGFLKPLSSISLEDVANKQSVIRIQSREDIRVWLMENPRVDRFIVQEAFEGVGIGVEVLAERGRVRMEMQHRRLRETLDGGSTYRVSIAPIEALSIATKKMVEALGYHGVGMWEYRFDDSTGQWVLLEINARFWGSLPLAIASGANFPYALYRMLVVGSLPPHSSTGNLGYRTGTRCRNLVKDFRASRKGATGSSDWSRLLTGRDHLDFFSFDDPLPMAHQIKQFFKEAASNRLRR